MKPSLKDPAKVLASKKKKHSIYARESHRVLNSLSIMVLTVTSIIITMILVPFLILFESTTVYSLVLFVGLLFGFIFSFLMLDLDKLEDKHHTITGIIIPLIAVLNIFLMLNLTKKVAEFYLLQINHNPMIISAFYLIGFILPYLFFGLAQHFKYKK